MFRRPTILERKAKLMINLQFLREEYFDLLRLVLWRAITGALACVVAIQPSAASAQTAAQTAALATSTLRQAGAARNILVGTAAASAYLSEPDDAAILGSEFSQLQAENEMKFGLIHPRPATDPHPYNFAGGDALVAFAQSHGMKVRGHTLVWHKQVSKWVTDGNFSPQKLAEILSDHISTLVTHYAGRVYAWDVVNEAFKDDGSMRSTIWYDQP